MLERLPIKSYRPQGTATKNLEKRQVRPKKRPKPKPPKKSG